MAVTVLIPTPLRPYTDNQDRVDLEGGSVGEILAGLTTRYTDLKRHLYTDAGQLRNFVNVYLGDEDIRHLEQGDATPVQSGDIISIVPSIAGGY